MASARKVLPSTTGLQVLIALVKSGSTTGAARLLNLSQSAVSKQLLAFEHLTGVPLFTRTNHGLILTEAGSIYVDRAKVAIQAMEDAALLTARLKPDLKILRLQVPPILGDRWLLPRFVDFAETHPEIDVQFTNFVSSSEVVSADGIFSFGEAPLDPTRGFYLFGEDVVLVSAPDYWQKAGMPKSFEDLQSGIMLEHPQTPLDWQRFTQARDLKDLQPRHTVRFGYYTMVIRAALAGQGMAFIPRGLIMDDLAAGRLINPAGFDYHNRFCYWFTASKDSASSKPLDTFIDWLRSTL